VISGQSEERHGPIPDTHRPLNITNYADFPTHIPQTRGEVLAEASFLFTRILNTQSAFSSESPSFTDPTMAAFTKVCLTPRLANAYLAVHYAHASSESCRFLWAESASWGHRRNARSFVEALERCATRGGRERKDAHAQREVERWAGDVWAEWEAGEKLWREGRPGIEGIDARTVERAHAAMIRLWASYVSFLAPLLRY
jgi:hypothetical protein